MSTLKIVLTYEDNDETVVVKKELSAETHRLERDIKAVTNHAQRKMLERFGFIATPSPQPLP